ncbi:hypothetical protein M0R45_001079 [Rubus argutus]|uniref:Uncharacterized protein n=1 Tax=Rubus argutus TaxID=59490 RepID=A0AAW1VMM3_RUBAR
MLGIITASHHRSPAQTISKSQQLSATPVLMTRAASNSGVVSSQSTTPSLSSTPTPSTRALPRIVTSYPSSLAHVVALLVLCPEIADSSSDASQNPCPKQAPHRFVQP